MGELVDLPGQGLVDPVAGHQHAHEAGPGLHGDRDRVGEPVALSPDRRGFLSLQGLPHDLLLGEVLARPPGTIAAGDDHAVRIGGDEEVRLEILAALLEHVQDRGLAHRRVLPVRHRGLEGGVVPQDADSQPELLVAVGLEGVPDLAGLLEPLVDREMRQLVRLEGGEGEARDHQGHHEGAREEEDLLGQSHPGALLL